MNPEIAIQYRERVEEFRRKHRTGLVTLVFTDIVGSTQLKATLGDREGVALIQCHHALVRDLLQPFAEAEEISTAGDSFFIVFVKPSDAARFALLLQSKLRALAKGSAQPLQDRIGIHIGEVVIEDREGMRKPKDLYGIQVDLCARVMGLAYEDQILLTRSAFDNARQVLKGEDLPGLGQLAWLNHGPYLLAGLDESLEICEVGETDLAALKPPVDAQKAHRKVSPDEEPVLGWRPALGQLVPNTKWVVEQKLGEGGFGEVWLGRHQTMKERRVFKFCFRADRVRSLKREMTLFRLIKERIGDHPNIVSLREVYFDQPPFYVEMDYVPGQDLKNWCEAQGGADKVPLQVKLEIIAQIADALQAAHDAGVIHRDLKPANILVSQPGAGTHKPSAKLTDFGIGQVVSQEYLSGVTKAGFTQTMLGSDSSSQTGTQLYMAPELLAGKPASTRSDIYSLGVVLFQFLQGNLTEPVTADWPQEIKDPLLKEDLRRCLAGKPEERFAGAAMLAESLRSYTKRQVALAERERAQRHAARWQNLTRISAATALLFLLLALAMGYGLRQANRERRLAHLENYFANISLAEENIEKNRLHRAYNLLMDLPEQFRGWEWGRLLFLCQQDQMTLTHTNEPRFVWFSPDNRQLLTLQEQFQTTWDLATGREVPQGNVPWSSQEVRTCTPHRKHIGTTNEDGRFLLWDIQNRSLLLSLAHTSAISCYAISPDETRIVTVASRIPRVWDARTGAHVLTLSQHFDGINWLAFSPDGQRLATVSGRWEVPNQEPPVKIFDLQSGKKLLTITNHLLPVYMVAFSSEGKRIATVGGDETARLFDAQTGQQLLSLAHKGPVYSVAFSRDSKQLLTGCLDTLARLWDAQSGALLRVFPGHQDGVFDANFSLNGELVATVSRDRTAKIWDLRATMQPLTIAANERSIWSLAFSPDGKWLAAGGWDNRCRIWDAATGRELRSIEVLYPVLDLAFSPDGKRLATVSGNHTATVWDPNTGRPMLALKGHTNSVLAIAFSPDGRWLATGSRDATARLWDANSGRELRIFAESAGSLTHTDHVTSVAFSPDGRQLATASRDNTAKLWNAATGRLLHSFLGSTNDLTSVAFSPNGKWVLAGSEGNAASMRDVRSGREIHRLAGHFSHVCRAVFTPDGLRVATVSGIPLPTGTSRDHNVKFWDVESGHEVFTLEHPQVVVCLAFSPDGKRLATFSTDQKIRIWNAFPWRNQEYPGTAELPLEQRVELFKRQYWPQRLLAEAETGRQTNLPPAVRIGLGSRAPLLPPRDPKAGPNLVDLSAHYNVLLNENWQATTTRYLDKNFANLPAGLHTFNGIQFDVRGLVQLARASAATDWAAYPPGIDGIKLGQKFKRLHIVHSYRGSATAAQLGPLPIAKLIWHYAGGATHEVEIRSLRDAVYYSGELKPGEQALLAWQGPNSNGEDSDKVLRLCQSSWDNPRPDMEVRSVDYVSTLSRAAPFLLAMTLE